MLRLQRLLLAGVAQPARYLLPDTGQRNTHTPQLPWRDLRRGLVDAGWLHLSNERGSLTVGDTTLRVRRRRRPAPAATTTSTAVAGPADPDADVRLAITHAPYLRVLDQFAADGYDAVLAGHTHGGQVCLPGYGALTTNCDLEPRPGPGPAPAPGRLPPRRPRARPGCTSRPGSGTNPYVRFRVACRPEATLLTLVPRA